MSKVKKIGAITILIIVAASVLFVYHYLQTWPLRFHSELNSFFGENRWEQLSAETKQSRIYTVYYSSRNETGQSGKKPGNYHTWDIGFINEAEESELWTITDHTMRINHDKHWFLSPKRYSAKQAFTLELMDISFAMVGDKIQQDILQDVLPEQEASCLKVDISYRHGNPPPEMYDELIVQPWFAAERISARDYLETPLYDFYIRIAAHDYRVSKLEQSEQKHLMDSLDKIEAALQSAYGEYADYEIYLAENYRAEFSGEKAKQGF